MTIKRDSLRSVLGPLFIIPIGGLLILGLCYLLYLFIYNFVELRFFHMDPGLLPANIMRRIYVLVLLVLYLALVRTKISDLLKATILVGPLGIFVTTSILAFYENPALAIAAVVGIVIICIYLLYHYKKPWTYYYAGAIAVLVAIVLAWPEV